MTRIVAGAARGRRLSVPARGTRPTSDRVREALFASLGSRLGAWAGQHVLDLYAGTGALGLEALSRGAEHVLLVESDRRTAAVLRANVAGVGLTGAGVLVADVRRLVEAPPPPPACPPYGVVLADPPYDHSAGSVAAALAGLDRHGWLADGAVVAIERPAGDESPPWPATVTGVGTRRYGQTVLWYGRRGAADGGDAGHEVR